MFSPLYWVYRYDAYLVGFGIFVAAVVLGRAAARRGPCRAARLPALLVASLVPIVADVREGLVPDAEIAGMRNTYLEQYQTAEFIRSPTTRGDAVIVNDLGAVTYYTQARILDLVGLGDIEPLVIMRRTAYTSREVVAWTARYRADDRDHLARTGAGVRSADPARVGQGRRWSKCRRTAIPSASSPSTPSSAGSCAAASHSTSARSVRTLGYRVKLRPPERMDAAALGLAGAEEALRAVPPLADAVTEPRGR